MAKLDEIKTAILAASEKPPWLNPRQLRLQAAERRNVAECCRGNSRMSHPYFAAEWDLFVRALEMSAHRIEKRADTLDPPKRTP